jgi:hypothetical protein
MKIDEFKHVRKGKRPHYVIMVPDAGGARNHELTVAGPDKLVRKVFKNADFSLKIEPGGSREDWERTMTEMSSPLTDKPSDDFEPSSLFKRAASAATVANSVFVSLRRVKGSGTGYAFGVPLFLPTGTRVFFILPPVCSCAGVLIPATGDPDVFLAINGLGPPFVAASTLGGTAVDRVSFSRVCLPFMHFVPFFRVDGFRSGACMFFWGGFGLL